jgi:hypothetical protein
MADDDLTPSESAILIVLMVEAREVTNPELVARYGLNVRKENRDKLNELGYVASRRVGQPYMHVLDDKGWLRVQDDLDVSSPNARAIGAALAALHSGLRERVLPRTNCRNLAELFALTDIMPPQRPTNLEVRLRSAYAALVSEPGEWLALTRLRPFFADVSRDEVDEALDHLLRSPDVNIVPESNQKSLSEADRAAALRIGGQDKHLLAIGV